MPQDVTKTEGRPYVKVKKKLKTIKMSQLSITIYHKCLQLSKMRLLEIQLLRIMFTVSI